MRRLIFAYWVIYEYFYKRRMGYKPNNLRESWRAAFGRLHKYPEWYENAREIHEHEKARIKPTCNNCKWNYDGDGCDVVNCTPRSLSKWEPAK
jgi:hypothetical protein